MHIAGKLFALSLAAAGFFAAEIAAAREEKLAAEKVIVVLDAGHGGTDDGAVARGGKILEKDFNLDITLRAGKLLESAGLTLLYTRCGDETLTLGGRAAETHGLTNCPALFVSIHANFAEKRDVRGVETFVLTKAGEESTSPGKWPCKKACRGNENDEANLALGEALHKRLLPAVDGAPDRKVRFARFHVLRDAAIPAALVECGFISNAEELALLLRDDTRETIAEAIAEGIKDFCRGHWAMSAPE